MQPLFTCSKLRPALHGRSLAAAILCASYFFSYLLLNAACLATGSITDEYSHLDSSNMDFLNASCRVTLYPNLCFKTLSPYVTTIQTSPTALADAALNVSLRSAKSASDTVSDLSIKHDLSPRELQAMRDCLENVGDSVDELQKSLVAMKDLGVGTEFEEKMGDVMTWVSAALTDEDTCMDGFDEHGGGGGGGGAARLDGRVKSKIRSSIVKLAELTSNALALINIISST